MSNAPGTSPPTAIACTAGTCGWNIGRSRRSRALPAELQGQPIDRIASVASFFVSRVDTLVDRLLTEHARAADDGRRGMLEALKGTIAIANAKFAYEHFQRSVESARFRRLRDRGGQNQRPLWASTSTKNPDYHDTLYVSPLIGPHTVNTMPLETIATFRDHGTVDCRAVTHGLADAQERIRDLEQLGISMTAITTMLIQEGVDKFCQALHSLLDTVEQRQARTIGGVIVGE